MQVTIYPGALSGSVTPPPSKSQSHRLVLAAALAAGESRITKLGRSRDITATLDCVRALGAEVRLAGDTAEISGIREGPEELPQMDCGESGSTLRFLIPVALAAAGGGVFYGRGRLMQRPQEPYFAIFREKGIAFSQNGDTLTVRGSLTPGIYRLPGNVSSQFITGLLYALPLLDGDSEILLTTELESAPYVDMTLDALERAGVRVVSGAKGWHVPGNQRFRPLRMQVEGDWSQAAFFAAARFPGDGIRLLGLDPASRQGDRCLLDMETRLRQPGRAVLDVSGKREGEVWVGIRPEGFIPDGNGPFTCQMDRVEVMGRDVSVVSTHPQMTGTCVRSIVSSENRFDPQQKDVRFRLKPYKVFLFDRESEERI